MTKDLHDSRFIETALPELGTYLLSDALYWPLGGSLPRLTPGALLLALRRAETTKLPAAPAWIQQLSLIRTQRRSAWERKIVQEFRNRLRLWSASCAEWQSAQAERRADYTGEVRSRVILQLLLAEADLTTERDSLEALDVFLRASLKPGPFLWEPGLEMGFPPGEFWFLYGKLI